MDALAGMGTETCPACRAARETRAASSLRLHVKSIYAAFGAHQQGFMADWLSAWRGGFTCPQPTKLLAAFVTPLLTATGVAVRSPSIDGTFVLRPSHALAGTQWRFVTATDALRTFVERVLKTPRLFPNKHGGCTEDYVTALRELAKRDLLRPATLPKEGCGVCGGMATVTLRIKAHLDHFLRKFGANGKGALQYLEGWMESPDRKSGCPTAATLAQNLAWRAFAVTRVVKSAPDGAAYVQQLYAGTLRRNDVPLHRVKFENARVARRVYLRMAGVPDAACATGESSFAALRCLAAVGAWPALLDESLLSEGGVEGGAPRKRRRSCHSAVAALDGADPHLGCSGPKEPSEGAADEAGAAGVRLAHPDALRAADQLLQEYRDAGCVLDATPLPAVTRGEMELRAAGAPLPAGAFASARVMMEDLRSAAVWHRARSGTAYLLQLHGTRVGPYATMRLAAQFLDALTLAPVCTDSSKPLPPRDKLTDVFSHCVCNGVTLVCVMFSDELAVFERPLRDLRGIPLVDAYARMLF